MECVHWNFAVVSLGKTAAETETNLQWVEEELEKTKTRGRLWTSLY